jgi:quercetin dioxygenase-like cupin family protein
MRMTRSFTSFAVAAVVVVVVQGDVARAKAPEPLVQSPAAEMKWEEFYPGGPVEAFMVGSKEGKHGPTAFFIKFKAGFDSGWHIHESAYQAVILSGTMLETSKGSDPPKPLGPGSFYSQPGVVHRTQCTAASDCLVYIHEAGRFSFTPTTEEGKPLPAAIKGK